MRKVHNYAELLAVNRLLSYEVGEYLEGEFKGVYDYLSNGESIYEFHLHPHQAITILERKEEINQVVNNSVELEFVEAVQLGAVTIQRIGIYHEEDVQLCYCIDGKNGHWFLED